jgi:GcrA cell cycle regulator
MTWTEEITKRVVELKLKGLTASQIGRILDCTRNTIIGKLNRLGIKAPSRQRIPNVWRSARNKSAMTKRKQKPPIYPTSFKPTLQKMKSEGSMPDEPPTPHEMPPARATGMDALLALQPGDCRWPIGEVGTPEFRFCGAPCEFNRMYCEYHHIASTKEERYRGKIEWQS